MISRSTPHDGVGLYASYVAVLLLSPTLSDEDFGQSLKLEERRWKNRAAGLRRACKISFAFGKLSFLGSIISVLLAPTCHNHHPLASSSPSLVFSKFRFLGSIFPIFHFNEPHPLLSPVSSKSSNTIILDLSCYIFERFFIFSRLYTKNLSNG